MAKIGNRGTVPQGMLAPAGYVETIVDPNVQATTRPAGTLLSPSPGYDSIRRGKTRFQGRGPTGGFQPSEFAEDVGATGAVLSVIPGVTTAIEASEWLPEDADSLPEGSVIIADRKHEPGFAQFLHDAYSTLPDMGDRTADRPLTKSKWLVNPVGMFRKDYREHPAMTVIASAGLVWLVNIVGRDLDRFISGYRPRGVGQAVTEPPAAAAGTVGDVAKDISDATQKAVNQIGETVDNGVKAIGDATDNAVNKIQNTAKE